MSLREEEIAVVKRRENLRQKFVDVNRMLRLAKESLETCNKVEAQVMIAAAINEVQRVYDSVLEDLYK